jgi:L-rhamnose isomerase/sugar isomerase
MDAYDFDVRPLLAQVRQEMGLHPDPIAAYRADNYAKRVAEERGVAGGSLGGYPG